jgi:hypothetical protein
MVFKVIDGGRVAAMPAETDTSAPGSLDVRLEAERRLQAVGYDRWRQREALTGVPMPRDMRYHAMQVSYVALAISGLASIPQDFRSDAYWPVFEREVHSILKKGS